MDVLKRQVQQVIDNQHNNTERFARLDDDLHATLASIMVEILNIKRELKELKQKGATQCPTQ